MTQIKFRDLSVGDTFDFIGPERAFNSYYNRCKKLSTRTYTPVDDLHQPVMRVGSINADVFHVEHKS